MIGMNADFWFLNLRLRQINGMHAISQLIENYADLSAVVLILILRKAPQNKKLLKSASIRVIRVIRDSDNNIRVIRDSDNLFVA